MEHNTEEKPRTIKRRGPQWIRSVVSPDTIIFLGVKHYYRKAPTLGAFGKPGRRRGARLFRQLRNRRPQSMATVLRKSDDGRYVVLTNGQIVKSDHRLASRT